MKKRFGKKGAGSSGGSRIPRLTDPGPGMGLSGNGGGYDDSPSVVPLPSEQEINAMFLDVMKSHG